MSNHDFVLKSGEKLHITSAPFEQAIALTEVVSEVTRGMDPTHELDSVILLNPRVRAAVYPLLPFVMWGIHKLSVHAMDDPAIGDKLKADWLEIASFIIQVNSKIFFSLTSSKSTTPSNIPPGSPASP